MSHSDPIIKPEAVPLLQKALDHITAHPEDWDQTYWRSFIDPVSQERTDWRDEIPSSYCGTVGCLAGWVVTLSGEVTDTNCSGNVLMSGSPKTIRQAASQILTGDDNAIRAMPGDLFYQNNTYQDLWEKANELCGGLLTVPLEFQ